MEVKKAIKKIVALGTGLTMVGATVLGAMAVNLSDYPKPFLTDDNKFDGMLVVGDTAAPADIIGVTDIMGSLQFANTKKVSVSSSIETTVSDGYKILASDNKINMYESLYNVKQSLTDNDLPELLADVEYKNDEGTTYDYTQKLVLGDGTGDLTLKFAQEDDVSDDPALFVQGGDGQLVYKYVMTFDKDAVSDIKSATDDTLEDFEDTAIVLYDQTYTIIDANSNTGNVGMDLTLMGGETTTSMFEGDTKTVSLNGEDHEITAYLISDTGTTEEVKFIIDGITSKALEEGQTEKINGIEIGVKEILSNEAGEADAGKDLVEFYIGAQKVFLKDTNTADTASSDELQVGETDIDDMDVVITGTSAAFGTDNKIHSIEIQYVLSDDFFVWENNDYTDMALGAFKLIMEPLTLPKAETIDIKTSGDEVSISMPTDAGEVDIPALYDVAGTWAYGESADKKLIVKETGVAGTAQIDKSAGDDGDEYFLVSNSQNKESYVLKLDNVNVKNEATAEAEIKFEDIRTGTKYTCNVAAGADRDAVDGTTDCTFNIGSVEVEVDFGDEDSATGFEVSLNLNDDSVPSFIDKLTPITMYTEENGEITIWNALSDVTSGKIVAGGVTLDLDGDGTAETIKHVLNAANPANDDQITVLWSNAAATTTTIELNADETHDVLDGTHNFYGPNGERYTLTISGDLINGADIGVAANPIVRLPQVALLEEDRDDDNIQGKLVVEFTDTTGDADVSAIKASTDGTNDDTTNAKLIALDDSDKSQGYTKFGTWFEHDYTNSDSADATLIYPGDEATGNFFIADIDAIVVDGASDEGTLSQVVRIDVGAAVLASEAGSIASKNTLLVGGPCANAAAGEAMGLGTFSADPNSDYQGTCAVGFEAGKAMIKLYPQTNGKIAILVAGYSADDTRAAAQYVSAFKENMDVFDAATNEIELTVAGKSVTNAVPK